MNIFLEGMGTVVNLFVSEQEIGFSLPARSDEEAIYGDWQGVGVDLRYAAEGLHSIK